MTILAGGSIKTRFPGVGNVTEYVSSEAVNNPINATTTTAITGFRNPIRSGWVRVRGYAYPGAGAGVCSAVKITATDGSITNVLANIPTFAASEFFDLCIPFHMQIDITTINVAITMTNVANGQLTADIEVAGNP